jgi:nucleotide sugar dehydrogenase
MASGTFASRYFTRSSGAYLRKGRANLFARRSFDLLVALAALIVSSPLFLAVALLLTLSGGPILDRQTRVGRHRKEFSILTFRAKPRALGERESAPAPKQVEKPTAVDRFIDRTNLQGLPKLLNVLLGQMSVFGPRCEAPERTGRHPELWNVVLSVKPGLVAIASPTGDPSSTATPDADIDDGDTTGPLLERLEVEAEYARKASVIRDLGMLSRKAIRKGPPGSRRRGFYEAFGKRLLDLVAGLLFALLALPVQLALLFLSTALYGWPPIVRLPSVGKSGSRFHMFRLRTSPAGTRRQRAYPRVAEVLRRWRLDGLPQVTNVLLGQMSIVGPRAVRPEDNDDLLAWQQQRWEVKPGLIGLSQLESRNNGAFHSDITHHDIQYIDQLSFSTDVRIILRTVFAIRGRDQASLFLPRAAGRGEILHVRLMAADMVLWLLAIPAAAWAYAGFSLASFNGWGMAAGLGLAAAAQLVWAIRFGMYRGRWKIASPDDLLMTGAGAAFVTCVILVAGSVFLAIAPSGALVAAGSFFLVGAVTARSAAALAYSRRQPPKESATGRLLVYGAGEVGMDAVRAIWTNKDSPYLPVAFLDDDPGTHRKSVLGLPVLGGRNLIAEMARRYDADSLLIAMPSAHPRDVSEVDSIAAAAGLDVQILPPLEKWLSALLVERARSFAPSEEPMYPDRVIDIRPAPDRIGETAQFDLAVVGLGYVGLPLAMEASRIGLRVCGLDVNSTRVDALNEGTSYIDGITDLELGEALNEGFVATTDRSILAGADCITVSVPTPLRDNLPDLSAVIGASEAVGGSLRPGQLVILESTTYPGTTEEVMKPILEELSGLEAGTDFYLAYSPERIDPGNDEWGVHNTPKLIGGINQASTEMAANLYSKFCPVVTMAGTREAEMAKLLENTYRHVNIALINEMAIFCRQLGVDIWETIRGAATKPFGFQAFYPGPGVGGHCIPIDPNYLSYRVRQLGEQFRLIELAQEINEFMPEYVAKQAVDILTRNGIEAAAARILMLGVAYKPGIGDTRETPAADVVRRLREAGAVVDYADPFVDSFIVDDIELTRHDDPLEASSEADLTIIHTPHDTFNFSEIEVSAGLIFDLRGTLPNSAHERL